MDWEIDDETLAAMGGERITITFNVAQLVPGTYVFLDADDEVITFGEIEDPEDFENRDTDPYGSTIVGPMLEPRAPARPITARTAARTATIKGSSIRPRAPVPMPDLILNEIEIDDDDNLGGPTKMGSPIQPRRPAPIRGKR